MNSNEFSLVPGHKTKHETKQNRSIMPEIMPYAAATKRCSPSRNAHAAAAKMGSVHHSRRPSWLNSMPRPTVTWSAHNRQPDERTLLNAPVPSVTGMIIKMHWSRFAESGPPNLSLYRATKMLRPSSGAAILWLHCAFLTVIVDTLIVFVTYINTCLLSCWQPDLPLSSLLMMDVFDRCHHQIKGQLLISHFRCQHREKCPQFLVQIKRMNVGYTRLHRCFGMPCWEKVSLCFILLNHLWDWLEYVMTLYWNYVLCRVKAILIRYSKQVKMKKQL